MQFIRAPAPCQISGDRRQSPARLSLLLPGRPGAPLRSGIDLLLFGSPSDIRFYIAYRKSARSPPTGHPPGDFMDRVYIAGIGMTPFGRHLDRSVKELTAAAVALALADAGAQVRDVQAAWFANTRQGQMEGQN